MLLSYNLKYLFLFISFCFEKIFFVLFSCMISKICSVRSVFVSILKIILCIYCISCLANTRGRSIYHNRMLVKLFKKWIGRERRGKKRSTSSIKSHYVYRCHFLLLPREYLFNGHNINKNYTNNKKFLSHTINGYDIYGVRSLRIR